MLRRCGILFCVLSLVFFCTGVASAVTYTITDVGVSAYGLASKGLYAAPAYAMSVNNGGEVAFTTQVTTYRSYLYTAGTVVDLTAQFTANTSAGCSVGINNLGVVAGHSQGVATNAPRGYIYSGGTAGTFTDFKVGVTGVANGKTSYSYDVNDSGWAIGTYYRNVSPVSYGAFLYSNRSGSWVTEDIGTGGYGYTANEEVAGRAINGLGQIACSDYGSISVNIYNKSFVWTPGVGGAAGTKLNLPGMAAPADINDSGVVVGTNSVLTNQQAIMETLVAGAYVKTDMGFLGTGTQSRATGIANDGTIVGWSMTSGAATPHAFIYKAGVMTDLNTTALVPGLDGWTLQYAMGISNDGTQIVGYGTNGSGQSRVFVLAAPVPEPSTLLLAASGLVGLLAYAWRKRK